MKTCSKCKRSLGLEEFWGRPDRTSLRSWCIDCAMQWHREHKLLKKYGITREQYDALLERQKHRCAICRRTGADNRNGLLHVDHNHETGEVRGLLCFDCNSALGRFGDNAERIRRALRYLEGHLRAADFESESVTNRDVRSVDVRSVDDLETLGSVAGFDETSGPGGVVDVVAHK